MNSLFFICALTFYYINVPFVDMREKPEDGAEIVSQGYFSEEVSLLEEQGDWALIKTLIDNYPGWAKKSALCKRDDKFSSNGSVYSLTAHVYSVEDTIYGPIITLPFESRFFILEEKEPDSRWLKIGLPDGRTGYIQRGDVVLERKLVAPGDICEFSKKFLNLPYTWGGRSSYGYDCSGFVQMLFRQMGMIIPRDSKDQIHWEGFEEVALDKMKPGDLVFWGLSEDKIRHLGLYMGDGKFIHSGVAENKPYIRIANLADPHWNGSGRFKYVAARSLKDSG